MGKSYRLSAFSYRLRAGILSVAAATLFALPARPNACTLTNHTGSACASKTCTLSAIVADSTHANWTGTGCAANGYVPAGGSSAGAGDTVIIPDAYHLTVDQNWTIGANNANNGVAAIQLNNSSNASFTVGPGATLTLRGDLLATNGITAPLANAGATIIFDSSHSASPATTRYRASISQNPSTTSTFAGTSASHVTVTSVGGSALNGQFRPGSNAVGATPGSGGWIVATYTDFSNIGDAATNGESFAFKNGGAFNYVVSFIHCTFNNVGPMYTDPGNVQNTATLLVDHSAWSNSPQALTGAGNIPLWVTAGGAATIANNVFDRCAGSPNQPGMVWSGNYFGGGICNVPSSTSVAQTDNFVRQVADIGSFPLSLSGNLTGGYDFLDHTTQDNPHWTAYGNVSATISGFVFDDPDDVTADSGEIFQPTHAGSGAYTQGIGNSILAPTKTGKSVAELIATTNSYPSDASLTMNINHNTWVGSSAVGAFGMIQTNESGASLVPIAKVESNLAWSNGGTYYKVSTINTSSPLQNPVTTADYNAADANAIQTIACAACTNQGNSYIGKWTATPGAHDVSASPFLADPNLRNVALWDTRYLGTAAATQWTSGSGTVALGGFVSDSHAGYYGGSAINFRCIYATGCVTGAANSEPNVGAAWRTYWEFASLYDLRTATAAGTMYTDGAIGCAGCTAIQALVKWVQRGFTPQNPALWCAGHDGETIGAVPFCAKGKVLIGILAGM